MHKHKNGHEDFGADDRGFIRREPIHDMAMFRQFGCDIAAISPPTPDLLEPDAVIALKTYMGFDLRMPDGKVITMWVFHDAADTAFMTFPSGTIRVREGQVVHTRLSTMHPHTIHHHGIEATQMNDGAAHTSFAVARSYTYQWFASQAGTYLYHCHINTVLHFEMGMYGMLIIDPPEGQGRVYRDGPAYDVEAVWMGDEIDPQWHEFEEDAGLACPFSRRDFGFNRFEPKYFLISGVPHPLSRSDPRTIVRAKAGEAVLIRTANCGYTLQEFSIEGLAAEVVSVDGRPLAGPYSESFRIPSGTPFELTTGQRMDLMLYPRTPGKYLATIKFRDWISRKVLGIAETYLHID